MIYIFSCILITSRSDEYTIDSHSVVLFWIYMPFLFIIAFSSVSLYPLMSNSYPLTYLDLNGVCYPITANVAELSPNPQVMHIQGSDNESSFNLSPRGSFIYPEIPTPPAISPINPPKSPLLDTTSGSVAQESVSVLNMSDYMNYTVSRLRVDINK
jgi:hypothetical protein